MSSSLHSDLNRKVECSGYDMEYWKSQNLPFRPHLNEHAQNLKKMVVFHSPQFAMSSLDKLEKSKEISNTEVVFRIKKL
ncbi:hypothetical protein ACFXTO_033464 [Malus domestica]